MSTAWQRRQPLALMAIVAAVALLAAAAAQSGGPPAQQAQAEITVIVPADAEIFFDGQLTTQKGSERLYVTPPLVVGKTCYYDVLARWQEKGKVVEQTREVEVSGGAKVRVDFTRPAPGESGETNPMSSEELASRTVYRRAVDAVIWGLPLVSEDAVKQAYFRDGKAKYNDIVWWPKGGGWKNQSPTPNVNTRYMYFFINTKQDGPVVVELPPAVLGASFYGTIEDAWYVPLVDIGFEGKGGKYLVLPPDYKGDIPEGYTAVRPNTYNTMTLLRSILASDSEKDEHAGNDLVKQVRIYPLSKAAKPPAQRLLDMTDVMYNGLIKYDETFFNSLSRMLKEETVQPRDLEMMGMLLPLGIERGKEFKPDVATVSLLKKAAAEAHAWLIYKAATDVTPWWPESQWCVPPQPLPCQPHLSGRCRITLM
jgi:uncharacterized protein (TIGR03000 family)